jgi:type IV secretory pathway TrbL component
MIIGVALEELLIDFLFVGIVAWIIGKYLYDKFGGIDG